MSKVSVVVPIYKVERYLGNCIESLIGQTLKDIEIILVDDGSPDNCPSICDEYAAKDGRIKVIHKPNGGVSAARNDGLKAATGEYIIFCDSDDWMELDAFEVLYEAATTNDSDIAIGDVYMTYGDGGNKYVKFYKDGFTTLDRSYITELIKADIAEAEKGHFRLISLHSVTAGIKYLRLGCAIIGIIEIAVLIQNLSV